MTITLTDDERTALADALDLALAQAECGAREARGVVRLGAWRKASLRKTPSDWRRESRTLATLRRRIDG